MNTQGDNQRLSEREEIELLLPWYANGTLSPEDTQRVDRHLEQDAKMRDELACIKLEQEAAVQSNQEMSTAPSGALKSILGKIAETEKAPAEEKKSADILDFVRKTLSEIFQPPVVQYTAAAAILILIIQAGAILSLIDGESPDKDIPGRTKVGDTSTLPKDFLKNFPKFGLKGQRFVIGYAPITKISDIYQHLSKHRGLIVDGPKKDDKDPNRNQILFTVLIPENVSMEQVIQELRAAQEKGMVKSFEKLGDSINLSK